MADKVHCIRKTLRLMPEEAKMLAKKACDNGMNEAEYIRLLISQKPNDYPEVRKILMGYAREYSADARRVFKIGASFSSETGTIADWICV